MKELLVIIFCFVVCVLALIGINKLNMSYKYKHGIDCIERIVKSTDTLYLKDTVYIDKPKLVYKRVVDTIYLPKDTILPVIEKSYSDSSFCAVVEGLEYDSLPRLKEISVFPSTKVITNEVIRYEYIKPKKKIRLGLGVGLGYNNKEILPMVGVAITYH